jgi:hypothetical protein
MTDCAGVVSATSCGWENLRGYKLEDISILFDITHKGIKHEKVVYGSTV